MRFKKNGFRALVAIAIVSLLGSTFPTVASAETPSLTKVEKIEGGGEYIVGGWDEGVKVSSQHPANQSKYYRLSVFDTTIDAYVGSCDYYEAGGECEFRFTDHLSLGQHAAGMHSYKGFLEERNNNFVSEPKSMADLINVVSESEALNWERKKIKIKLTTDTPILNTYGDTNEQYSEVDAEVNQETSNEGYGYYLVNETTQKIISFTPAGSYEFLYSMRIPTESPGHYVYKMVLAADGGMAEGVEEYGQIEDIIVESNPVVKTAVSWEIYRGCIFAEGCAPDGSWNILNIIAEAGSGNKLIYMVHETTGNVVANENDDTMQWLAETENAVYYESYPYVADNFNDDPVPSHVSELTGIVYPSNKEQESYAFNIQNPPIESEDVTNVRIPGVQDDKELAGGCNPTKKCLGTPIADPVNSYTGEFYETKKDLISSEAGIEFDATRTFSTQRKDIKGLMGFGWRNAYEMKLVSPENLPLMQSQEIHFEQESGSIAILKKAFDGKYVAPNLAMTVDNITGKITIVRNKEKTFVFDSMGKLLTISDIHDNKISLTYAQAKLSSATDSYGNVQNYTYNAAGLIQKIENQNGRKVEYTYSTNRLTNVVNEHNVSTSYTYDGSRRVKTLVHANGGITQNFYDTSNRVIRQDDPLLKRTLLAYDEESGIRTTKITYPDGSTLHERYAKGLLTKETFNQDTALERSFDYVYDGFGNVISTIHPDWSSTSSVYDKNGYLVKHTNALGGVSTFTNNALGEILTMTSPYGETITNVYNDSNDLISTTNALGEKNTFVWNSDGTLKEMVDPNGNASTNPSSYKAAFSYSSKGLVESVETPAGKETYVRDALGRVIAATSPLGNLSGANASHHTRNVSYGRFDLPTSTVDELGNESKLTYSNAGQVIEATDALTHSAQNVYDLLGRATSVIDSDGTTTYTYDSMGRVLTTTNAANQVTTNTYNKQGDLIKVVDANGKITTMTYDSMSRVVSVKDAKSNLTQYFYDEAGNTIQEKDTLGNNTYSSYGVGGRAEWMVDKEGNKTSYYYDAAGRVSSIVKPNEITESYEYDKVGNLVKRTNPMGSVESWTYDQVGNVSSYTNSESDTEQYSYNANGSLVSMVRGDGSIVEYTVGRTGLMDSVNYPGLASDVQYSYDVLGQVVSEAIGSKSPVITQYDAMGRVLSRGETGNKMTYAYNNLGQQKTVTYPSGRVSSYAYDANGNMSLASIGGIGDVSYSYDNMNMMTSATLPNGVVENIAYDKLNRQLSTTLNKNTEVLHKEAQTYTASGNVSSKAIGAISPVVETFKHDALDRVTESTSAILGSSGLNSYNEANHLIKISGETIVSDMTGKPISIGAKALGYDLRGNRVSESISQIASRELSWNSDDTLSEVDVVGSGSNKVVSYEYSANGLISERTINGNNEGFVWDETNANALLISDGEYEYAYGANRVPLAQISIDEGAVTYLHANSLGSVIATTSIAGNVFDIVNYNTYGKQLNNSVTNFGFAGEWIDPDTNYSYNRARWYDSSTGHFLSIDPLVQETKEAYGYVSGNPLVRIDPSGLFFKWAGEAISNVVINPVKNWVNDTADKVNSGDVMGVISNVGTALTVVGTGAAVVALAIGTGGAGVPALLAISSASTLLSTGAGLATTADTCINQGFSKECQWSMVNTVTGAIPIFGKRKYMKILNKEALGHRTIRSITPETKWDNIIRKNKRIGKNLLNMTDERINFMKRRNSTMVVGYLGVNTVGLGSYLISERDQKC